MSITDANECNAITQSFAIEEPPMIILSLDSQTNVLCYGEATGALGINVVGGRPGYTFGWTGPNGYSSNDQI